MNNQKSSQFFAILFPFILFLSFLTGPVMAQVQDSCEVAQGTGLAGVAAIQNQKDLAKDTVDVAQKLDLLSSLSAKNIAKGMKTNVQMNGELFDLSADLLNEGQTQAFTIIMNKSELEKPEYRKLKKVINEFDIARMNDKKGKVSFLKLAYIVPKAHSQMLNKELSLGKEYVERTNKNLEVVPSEDKSILKTIKEIPVLKNAHTELLIKDAVKNGEKEKNEIDQATMEMSLKMNEKFDQADRTVLSRLHKTNYKAFIDSSSLTQYYDLKDGSGTLVVTHTMAIIDYDQLNWFVKKGVEAFGESAQTKKFKEETAFTVDNNRVFFEELSQPSKITKK